MEMHPISSTNLSNHSSKISVIIPVYNQEKYVSKALNSLLNQTFDDFDVICINDGSTDNTPHILDKYAEQDSRIRVLHQNNQGIGRTRNTGLKIANGEYIAFLDPDDTFEKNALHSLYKQAKEQDCDFLAFNYKKVNDEGKIIDLISIKENLKYVFPISPDKTFSWREFKPKVFGGLYTVSWNKLYKSEFVKKNQLHFSKSSLGEDQVFVHGATLAAKNIGYSDNYFYNYLVRPHSAVRSISDKHLDIVKAMHAITNLIKKLGLTEELHDEYEKYIIRSVLRHEPLIKSKDIYKNLYKKILSKEQLETVEREKIVIPKLFNILDSIKLKKL